MERIEPPKWADRFLEWVCPDEYLEEIQGDLHEAFQWRAETQGVERANRRFVFEAIRTIQFTRFKIPDIMKNVYWHTLQNYFKTGFRFLWRTKLHSSINIFGLAIGIASATLAYLFLSDQFSYDQFHENADQIYRLTCSLEYEGEERQIGGASYIMGKVFPEEVPSIARASHLKGGLSLRAVGDSYEYQRFHYADRALFDMLDFTFVNGSPGDFKNPNYILVSESFAEQLTNTDELRLILSEEEEIFTIVGIFKDLPNNSTLRPEIIMPFTQWLSRVPARRTTNWFDINMNVFVQKRADGDAAALKAEINKVFAANFDTEANNAKIHLQAFTEMHTDASLNLGNGLRGNANFEVLRIVLIIGLLCLLISCFNYSNFATGNFLSRTKEVGIRQIVGANKGSIFIQFLTESFLSTAIATILSLLLLGLILPFFSTFVGEEYTLHALLNYRFFIGMVLILMVSTLLSGIYPSLVLASQKAGNALKQKLKVGGKSSLGLFLVMLQVSLTIFLIIGMLTFSRQLNHLVNFDLGYDDQNILQIGLTGAQDPNIDQLKKELSQLPFVQEVSSNSGYNGTDFHLDEQRIETNHLRVDEAFLDLLNMKLVEGRNFDPAKMTDKKSAILVNETFVKVAKLQNPVGQQIPFEYGELKQPTIIGVVKDYHFQSPKSVVEPLVMYTAAEYQNQELLVKLNTASSATNLQAIEATWRSIFPRQPINYAWLDESNANRMATEAQIKKLSQAGALIAIVLASLGLFGIVGIHVRQRLKEVSIRKVNGASPWNIYWLFSRKFSIWLGIGFIVGSLPAFWFLNGWLNNYPERISLGVGIPLIGIIICGLVFLAIISALLLRVIYLNPVVYLKDE